MAPSSSQQRMRKAHKNSTFYVGPHEIGTTEVVMARLLQDTDEIKTCLLEKKQYDNQVALEIAGDFAAARSIIVKSRRDPCESMNPIAIILAPTGLLATQIVEDVRKFIDECGLELRVEGVIGEKRRPKPMRWGSHRGKF